MNEHTTNRPGNGIQRAFGAILMTLMAVLLLASASTKFAQIPPVVTQLAADGIADKRLTFVAVLEFLSAVLFLVPRTRSIGLLLVSAFLGGAIATHLQHSKSIIGPSVVLALFWLGAWLRHPELLWSWSRATANTGGMK
jgi:DoxX-like protein